MDRARRGRQRTPFNLRRSMSLDLLIAAEEIAHETWVRAEVAKLRVFDGNHHPAIEELSAVAWRAWCEIGIHRRAAERAWRVPA